MTADVYIVTNQRRGTLYTGVTTNRPQRVWQHREGAFGGGAAKHRCHRLVWHEAYADVRDAIAAEKRIKGWRRAWKLALIEDANPGWADLWPTLGLIAPTAPPPEATKCRTIRPASPRTRSGAHGARSA